jgi:hypothetical protein
MSSEQKNKQLLQAVSIDGKIDDVKRAVKDGADVNCKNEFGETPLHLASENGITGVVRFLIENRANVNAKDRMGRTPLRAAFHDSSSNAAVNFLVNFLVREGADVNTKDNEDLTPLHAACQNGSKEAVHLLVSIGADLHAKDNKDRTPLHWACLRADQDGEAETVSFLVGEGADLYAKDKDGKTSLDVSTSDWSRTPLHWGYGKADHDGEAETVSFLVGKGADPRKDGSRCFYKRSRDSCSVPLTHQSQENHRARTMAMAMAANQNKLKSEVSAPAKNQQHKLVGENESHKSEKIALKHKMKSDVAVLAEEQHNQAQEIEQLKSKVAVLLDRQQNTAAIRAMLDEVIQENKELHAVIAKSLADAENVKVEQSKQIAALQDEATLERVTALPFTTCWRRCAKKTSI